MPNKLRLLSNEDIAENIIMSMSLETLQQYAYEEMLDWINNTNEKEFMEVYGDSPKYWAAPTLKDDLDKIFDSYRWKVEDITQQCCCAILRTNCLLNKKLKISVHL